MPRCKRAKCLAVNDCRYPYQLRIQAPICRVGQLFTGKYIISNYWNVHYYCLDAAQGWRPGRLGSRGQHTIGMTFATASPPCCLLTIAGGGWCAQVQKVNGLCQDRDGIFYLIAGTLRIVKRFTRKTETP